MSSLDGGSTIVQRVSKLLAVANHDFCPWANRYVYWLKQPIGWFVVAATAAMLTAVFLEPRVWIIVGALVFVMALGIAWPWAAIRGTVAEIGFDCRRCSEGDRVRVRLFIHNRLPWPIWGLAVENGFFLNEAEGNRPVAALACVPSWSRSEFIFEFKPNVRGVFPHELPELTTGFPFGIWRAARKVAVGGELLVWPRTTRLTSIPSLGGDISDVIGMMFDRPGSEGDVIGTRPFREGDRLRSIHWAQTARRDALIVTERQAPARRLVNVAVDEAAFVSNSSLRQELETAIRVAASIAVEFHAHHADVRFMLGEIDLRLPSGTTGANRLLDALARYRPTHIDAEPIDIDREALAMVITISERLCDWKRSAANGSEIGWVLIADAADDLRLIPKSRNIWMTIDSELDTSQQLRHQWERVCHGNLAK